MKGFEQGPLLVIERGWDALAPRIEPSRANGTWHITEMGRGDTVLVVPGELHLAAFATYAIVF